MLLCLNWTPVPISGIRVCRCLAIARSVRVHGSLTQIQRDECEEVEPHPFGKLCAVASIHLWQQNGFDLVYTCVPQDAYVSCLSGCPNFCHAVCLVRGFGRELRFSVWMLKGAWRLRAGGRRVPGPGARTVYFVQPNRTVAMAMPLVFRPLLRGSGGGRWANAGFLSGRKPGEWACGVSRKAASTPLPPVRPSVARPSVAHS